MSARNRNYAASQRHPAGYWLTFAVGVILILAAAFVLCRLAASLVELH